MTTDYVITADAAKQVRSALKQTFPDCKFSVTSGSGVNVKWTDDGPEVQPVKDAIVHAGAAKIWRDFRDQPHLRAHDDDFIYFDRYNVAERAAQEREVELRRQERQAQQQRQEQALHEAYEAKRKSNPARRNVLAAIAARPGQRTIRIRCVRRVATTSRSQRGHRQ